MKTTVFLFILSMFGGQIVLSQNIEHIGGGSFLKRVEYNVIVRGETDVDNVYNLKGKSILDRILFGNSNSFVEFVFKDSPEGSNEVLAFRVIKNSQTDSYQLEVLRMTDVEKLYSIERFLSTKVNEIIIPSELNSMISLEGKELIHEINKNVRESKYDNEIYDVYRPEPRILQISNKLAEKLHEKVVGLIFNFNAEGGSAMIADGYEVTFHCVVENELWTLNIHLPQKKALNLSNIFCQLILSVQTDSLDEVKYLKLLKEID